MFTRLFVVLFIYYLFIALFPAMFQVQPMLFEATRLLTNYVAADYPSPLVLPCVELHLPTLAGGRVEATTVTLPHGVMTIERSVIQTQVHLTHFIFIYSLLHFVPVEL